MSISNFNKVGTKVPALWPDDEVFLTDERSDMDELIADDNRDRANDMNQELN